jgi:hypothetical protein
MDGSSTVIRHRRVEIPCPYIYASVRPWATTGCETILGYEDVYQIQLGSGTFSASVSRMIGACGLAASFPRRPVARLSRA